MTNPSGPAHATADPKGGKANGRVPPVGSAQATSRGGVGALHMFDKWTMDKAKAKGKHG